MVSVKQEPLVGEELIRVGLETFYVRLEFQTEALEIGAAFTLTNDLGDTIIIDPTSRTGDVAVVWGLIGKSVLAVLWNEEISVEFEHGFLLTIPVSDGGFRGTLFGQGEQDEMIVEDF